MARRRSRRATSSGQSLDFLEDALRGRDGVEFPVVDLLDELSILAGQALVHLFLQAVRGPRDDEVSQGGPPPFAEPAVLLEELTVLRYGVFQFLDALDLPVPNPDGLVDHHVAAARIHRNGGEPRAASEPAQVSPATQRAEENAGIEEVVREPYAVAKDRTLRERARRVDSDHPDPPLFLPVELYELRDDAALADAWRPCETDRKGSTGLGVDLCDYPGRLFVFALYLRDHPRQRPTVARKQTFYEPVLAQA